jgi:hypothetical protein
MKPGQRLIAESFLGGYPSFWRDLTGELLEDREQEVCLLPMPLQAPTDMVNYSIRNLILRIGMDPANLAKANGRELTNCLLLRSSNGAEAERGVLSNAVKCAVGGMVV